MMVMMMMIKMTMSMLMMILMMIVIVTIVMVLSFAIIFLIRSREAELLKDKVRNHYGRLANIIMMIMMVIKNVRILYACAKVDFRCSDCCYFAGVSPIMVAFNMYPLVGFLTLCSLIMCFLKWCFFDNVFPQIVFCLIMCFLSGCFGPIFNETTALVHLFCCH